MRVPPAFSLRDASEIDRLIEAGRLATLVVQAEREAQVFHAPCLWDADRRVLSGHAPLGEPAFGDGAPTPALAIYTLCDAYVSPNWYPSKADDPRHAPTWNFTVLHLKGVMRWTTDPAALRTLLEALTETYEAREPHPWRISDAPEAYVTQLLAAIVGFELHVETVLVKRKLSQNRAPQDRDGVMQRLLASDDPRDQEVGRAMRDLT